jgi:site-specific recombinase XerD
MTVDLMLRQAIEVFLIARQADSYRPSTLDQYRWALVRLVKQGDKKLSDVGSDDIRQFLSYLQTDYQPKRSGGGSAPLGSASIFAAWKAIRAFYKWASPEFGVRNPSEKIPMPRHASPVIVPFSREELKDIVSACERTGEAGTMGRKAFTMKRPTAARDKAIVGLVSCSVIIL